MSKTPIFIDTTDSNSNNYKVGINVDRSISLLPNNLHVEGQVYFENFNDGSSNGSTNQVLKKGTNRIIWADSDEVQVNNAVESSTSYYITFAESLSHAQTLKADYELYYIPSSGTITAGTFSGNHNLGVNERISGVSSVGANLHQSTEYSLTSSHPSTYRTMKLSSPSDFWGFYINNAATEAIRGTNGEQNGDLLIVANDNYTYNSNNYEFEIGGYFIDANWTGGHQIDFTGQHTSIINNNITNIHEGLIVSSSGQFINLDGNIKPKINESLPYSKLCNIDNDTKVYGIISFKEDEANYHNYSTGGFVSKMKKKYDNEKRIFINAVGEGGIWVSDKNGILNNGDFITSSSIPGYGMKQTLNKDILCNHTVGKITCDCDFSLIKVPKQKLKTVNIEISYTRKVIKEISQDIQKEQVIYDENQNKYIKKLITETITTNGEDYDEYNLYNEEGNVVGKHKVYKFEDVIETKECIYYNENGDIEFVDDLDENGNQILDYKYNTRFLDNSANIIETEEEYRTRLNNGESLYIACFVGCTYHCG